MDSDFYVYNKANEMSDMDKMKDMNTMQSGARQNISKFPPYTPVGMTYTPMQQISTTYEPDKALNQGTIFPDLDLPFLGGGRM